MDEKNVLIVGGGHMDALIQAEQSVLSEHLQSLGVVVIGITGSVDYLKKEAEKVSPPPKVTIVHRIDRGYDKKSQTETFVSWHKEQLPQVPVVGMTSAPIHPKEQWGDTHFTHNDIPETLVTYIKDLSA